MAAADFGRQEPQPHAEHLELGIGEVLRLASSTKNIRQCECTWSISPPLALRRFKLMPPFYQRAEGRSGLALDPISDPNAIERDIMCRHRAGRASAKNY
jgi:hypothetical protein